MERFLCMFEEDFPRGNSNAVVSSKSFFQPFYFFKSSGLFFCPVAGQHLNLPISSHYQRVTGTAAAVFTCLLFLWRCPVFGLRPRGVSWYLFQQLPAWAGCKLNGDTVRALSHAVPHRILHQTHFVSLWSACVFVTPLGFFRIIQSTFSMSG